MSRLEVTWHSKNRKAQCPPNPNYPNGMDVDMSHGAKSCATDLPYPAPECGLWIIECKVCGYRVGVTAAGRPDDPKSVCFACPERSKLQ
jgi:hypothetical protein